MVYFHHQLELSKRDKAVIALENNCHDHHVMMDLLIYPTTPTCAPHDSNFSVIHCYPSLREIWHLDGKQCPVVMIMP
jgi:hypothetical protein